MVWPHLLNVVNVDAGNIGQIKDSTRLAKVGESGHSIYRYKRTSCPWKGTTPVQIGYTERLGSDVQIKGSDRDVR